MGHFAWCQILNKNLITQRALRIYSLIDNMDNMDNMGVIDVDGDSASEMETPAKVPIKKPRKNQKLKAPVRPPKGTCVAGLDIGLKNFAICVLEQREAEDGSLVRPVIREWRNTNLYQDRVGGKIIKYEAADKLIVRIRDHLDEVGRALNDWKDVTEVGIESQAASTNAIKRAEAFVFCYFVYRHPHIQVRSMSASFKLKLQGMTHSKDDIDSYAKRKKMSIKYGREYMLRAPDDCPYKRFLDPPPRKKRGEAHSEQYLLKQDDSCDGLLMALHMLGVPITI